MTKTLSISLIIVALVVGVGIGFMISPEYSNMESNKKHAVDLGEADKEYDLRFIDEMIAHHEGAIEMAEDAKNKSSREEIINLSNTIISEQSKEIEIMKKWKEEWYGVK